MSRKVLIRQSVFLEESPKSTQMSLNSSNSFLLLFRLPPVISTGANNSSSEPENFKPMRYNIVWLPTGKIVWLNTAMPFQDVWDTFSDINGEVTSFEDALFNRVGGKIPFPCSSCLKLNMIGVQPIVLSSLGPFLFPIQRLHRFRSYRLRSYKPRFLLLRSTWFTSPTLSFLNQMADNF